MARGDKGKAATADEEAPQQLDVSTAAADAGGSNGTAPAAAAAASPFGLSNRADFKRAASVPLGFTCLMTNQVRGGGGERERESHAERQRKKDVRSPPLASPACWRRAWPSDPHSDPNIVQHARCASAEEKNGGDAWGFLGGRGERERKRAPARRSELARARGHLDLPFVSLPCRPDGVVWRPRPGVRRGPRPHALSHPLSPSLHLHIFLFSLPQGAHVLTLLLSLFNAAAALAVLAAGWKRGWSGSDADTQWGWVNAGSERLAPSLGVASQVFGALTGVALAIAAAAALYLTNATLLFFRGWFEAAAAAGGRRAGLPAFAVGTNLLVWAGIFLGISSRAAKVGGPPGGSAWAFWLTIASGLAWLLKSHILYRQPPVEAVSGWLASVPSGGANPGSSVRPVLGSLPSGLRASLNKTPGVTVV